MIKSAYIFDIDMTLSDDTHRRHLMPDSYQNSTNPSTAWNAYSLACFNDKPIEPVKSILLKLSEHNEIILASSRESIAEELTWNWLVKHDFPVNRQNIYLRQIGDHCSPDLLKIDMFKNIMAKHQIKGVFDDSLMNIVVAKRLGLKGYFVGSTKHIQRLQKYFNVM